MLLKHLNVLEKHPARKSCKARKLKVRSKKTEKADPRYPLMPNPPGSIFQYVVVVCPCPNCKERPFVKVMFAVDVIIMFPLVMQRGRQQWRPRLRTPSAMS